MKVEIICRENELKDLLGIEMISYEEAVTMAFDKIAQHHVSSSWTDALSSHVLEEGISKLIEVPSYGCYKSFKEVHFIDEHQVLDRIWNIGGENGWYYANWLWSIRGFLDKVVGGVGLRRGRKNAFQLEAGDALDFWRVLYASLEDKRLLLYAEMKLPGEAWLEFRIKDKTLLQTVTFRPLGVWGRIYWFTMLPIHTLIFNGLTRKIVA